MRTELKHGAVLDTVSAEELRAALDPFAALLGGPQRQWPAEGITLDASGSGLLTLYRVPVDRQFMLHRLILDVDGHDPGTPYTNASGYADVLHNGHRADFFLFSTTAGGLPQAKTWSSENGIVYAERELVQVNIVGGPANGTIVVRGQGTLEPVPGN